MVSDSNGDPTTLELTEVETKLRQLLLDVAAYIDETSGTGQVESAVKVPDELAREKIVLRFTGGWVRDKLLGVGSHDVDVAINKMTGEHFGLKMIEYLELPGNAANYGIDLNEEKAKIAKEEKNKAAAKEKNEKAAGKAKNGKSASKEESPQPPAKEKSRKVAPGLHKIEANPEKSKNLETATTRIMGVDLDLVNLRKETYNEVSRNPQIEFGTPEEDAMRRDATVNAMFYNLNTSRIEDFTGRGFRDMEEKIIRTPLEPYQTFKDDPLRVLRLIRFASRLNYTIDPETEKAMSNAEIGEVLKIKISRERVGIELEKMLKGPDPLMALSLIDRLGLYNTIFTDPTRELKNAPDLPYFASAYKVVNELLSAGEGIPSTIPEALTRNAEEKYLAWICATVMPWADAPMVPHQKPTQRPHYAAYLVAREGFKAPNRICDVVAASLHNGDEIRQMVSDNVTARDKLGMAVRRWGASWRTQVLFSLTYEMVLGYKSRETLLSSYATFLTRLTSLNLLEAHTFRPLVTGTELAKALDTKPGPWMKDALDVVMTWQLLNPDITDPEAAISAVKVVSNSSSAERKDSELSSALAQHFLTLTIRPLFSQTPQSQSQTKSSHPSHDDTPLWKDAKNATALDLLRWTLLTLSQKAVEQHWSLIVPPILKMIDDIDVQWKCRGVSLLTLFLQAVPASLLSRTGLSKVFEEELWPLCTYLPTLTPEQDSAKLLGETIRALSALVEVIHPEKHTNTAASKSKSKSPQPTTEPTLSSAREKLLDRLLRDAILAPLMHAPPPTYPLLATSLLAHLAPLLRSMGIDSVKHLQPLTSLLADILAEPLIMAHVELVCAACSALASLIENAWPRVPVYRGVIVRGLSVAWVRYLEHDGGDEKVLGEVVRGLRDVAGMLDMVCRNDGEVGGVWAEEKARLEEVDGRVGGLFGEG